MPPFLEILTRTYKRPNLLAANQASLQAQTSADWHQTVLVDDAGRGCAWANARLAEHAPQLVGDWIWVLDDDDLCIQPTLVEELHTLVVLYAPDVVMLRMDHGPLGVLPDDRHWTKRPVVGRIGCSAFVVERHVWQWHAAAWQVGSYEADFAFINSIWDAQPRVYWHDIVASQVQRISKGLPE
jgi:glycosyltransferase involved in cell wall biosynthesis